MSQIPEFVPWGKKTEAPNGTVFATLDVISHCCDVAAVALALLTIPTIRSRMEVLARRKLDHVDMARLLVLVFCHDIGKLCRGFQSRYWQLRPGFENLQYRQNFSNWRGRIPMNALGHTYVFSGLFEDDQITENFCMSFPAQEMSRWERAGDFSLLRAAISHHGSVIKREPRSGSNAETWRANAFYDPFVGMRKMGEFIKTTFPDAFVQDHECLPDAAEFENAFAGLVMLADWLGSGAGPMEFPYDLAPVEGRWEASTVRARELLARRRIDVTDIQAWLDTRNLGFSDIFYDPITHDAYSPTGLQEAMSDLSLGNIVVVEGETGSGKTEAALWRYFTLLRSRQVDSLVFLLPTRVSAVQIEKRIRHFLASAFADAALRPNIVLAVPGYIRADGIDAIGFESRFKVQWPDVEDAVDEDRRWAAESPKRYLGSSVSVGTIDQALMSVLPIKHAQMRGFSMLRSLVVVDEVHASDAYMNRLLRKMLKNHSTSGGHALLLSATLGIAARDQLLNPAKLGDFERSEAERLEMPYPAVTDKNGTRDIAAATQGKTVKITFQPWMDAAHLVAGHAIDAARRGAKVLIIRNTVRGALEVQRELERQLGEDLDLLHSCRGVHAPHHGRYSAEDRRLLDEAVELSFGKHSSHTAKILVATQTIEISVDCSSYYMITDLAPVDVLLQRLGRLHRHRYPESAPKDFAVPQVVILVPATADIRDAISSGGVGRKYGFGTVYENVLSLQATWSTLIELDQIEIPRDNRGLVETCTNPATLYDLAETLGPEWIDEWTASMGGESAKARTAATIALDWEERFESRPENLADVTTRLGEPSRMVHFAQPIDSPFGQSIHSMSIAERLLPNDWAESTCNVHQQADGVALVECGLRYSRLGLEEA